MQSPVDVTSSQDQEEQQRQPLPSDEVNYINVSFPGLKKVSPHVLIGECQLLRRARTLGDVQEALQDANARLEELNLFKPDSVRADVSLEPEGVVNVAFVAEERKHHFQVGGNVDQKGDLTCDVKVEKPGLLGGPLSGIASVKSSVSQTHEFLLRLETPRFLGRRCDWSWDAARTSTDETKPSHYRDTTTSTLMRLADRSGAHAVSVEAALRDLQPQEGKPGKRPVSNEVRAAGGRSTKTSAKYTFRWDAGESSLAGLPFATSARCDLEAAGLIGDACFVRGETRVSSSIRFPWRDVSLGGVLACGLLRPAGGRPTCLQDRFFLGGASGSTSVLKGFAHRGVGPVGHPQLEVPSDLSATGGRDVHQSRKLHQKTKRIGDAIGGNAMLSALASLSCPLPLPNAPPGGGIGARLFGFLGLGALAERSNCGAGALTRSLLCDGGLRASLGAGISLPIAQNGAFELTFAYPLRFQTSDVREPWQIGLRFDMKT